MRTPVRIPPPVHPFPAYMLRAYAGQFAWLAKSIWEVLEMLYVLPPEIQTTVESGVGEILDRHLGPLQARLRDGAARPNPYNEEARS